MIARRCAAIASAVLLALSVGAGAPAAASASTTHARPATPSKALPSIALPSIALPSIALPSIATPSVAPGKAAPVAPVIMLLVDVSSSMADDDGTGTIKIEGAKRALLNVLDGLPPLAQVGLRVFPSPQDPCDEGSKLFDPTNSDLDGLRGQIKALAANGNTPTALALAAAARDVSAFGAAATIVLVSDGESNCGGAPCDVAKNIAAQGVQLTINTVGFQISAAGKGELTCISQATQGKYFDSNDSDELRTDVARAATPQLQLTLDQPAAGSVAGAGSLVTVAATVANISTSRVDDVRTLLAFPPAGPGQPDNPDPGVPGPVRLLGNLGPGESRQMTWQYRVDPHLDGKQSHVVVHATASNASPGKVETTIVYASQLDLSRAGPILRAYRHPAIVGDSYSAGEGAGVYYDGTNVPRGDQCHRSPETYAMHLNWPQPVSLLACSGALAPDITGKNHAYKTEAPQANTLAALADHDNPVDLVMMTIGGNDAGFKELIEFCVQHASPCQDTPIEPSPAVSGRCLIAYYALPPGLRPPGISLPGCAPLWTTFGAQAYAKIAGLGDPLQKAYDAVDNAVNAPRALARRHGKVAPILVLAYPRAVPYYTYQRGFCSSLLSEAELRFGGDFTDLLNNKIKAEVKVAHDRGLPITFVQDTEDAMQPNHTICDSDPHINRERLWTDALGELQKIPLVHTDDAGTFNEQLHPTAAGYLDITGALVRWSNLPANQAPPQRRRGDTPWYHLGSLPDGALVNLLQAPVDSATTVQPATLLTLQGGGYAPDRTVTISVQSVPRVIGTPLADAQGNLDVRAVLPGDLAPGIHVVVARGLAADGSDMVTLALIDVERAIPAETVLFGALSLLLLLVAAVGWLTRRRRIAVPQLRSSRG